MSVREATCRCGQLTMICTGDPVRISVCHCLACQKRSGSAFAAQARYADGQVRLTGAYREWSHIGETGSRTTFRFCGTCGATISFSNQSLPGTTAIPIGAFADPGFPPPLFSVYENRKHPWVAILGDAIDRYP